jgi:hypothetical protein
MLRLQEALVLVSATLSLTSAASAKTFVLTGRVSNAVTGQPIPRAKVSYDSGAVAFTDSNGNYALTLTQYTPHVVIEADSMLTVGVLLGAFGDSQVRNIGLLDHSALAIRGRVVDKRNGAPLSRAMVRVLHQLTYVLTDSSGRFVLPMRSPGTYTVWAQKQLLPPGDIIEKWLPVTLPADGDCEVELQLERYVDPSEFHGTP